MATLSPALTSYRDEDPGRLQDFVGGWRRVGCVWESVCVSVPAVTTSKDETKMKRPVFRFHPGEEAAKKFMLTECTHEMYSTLKTAMEGVR